MKQIRVEKIRSRREKAQGMVEFALTLPLLLVLFFGIIEFGRLLFYFSMVTTATREAARYGSAAGISGNGLEYYRDCIGIRAAAKRIGSLAGVQDASVNIRYDEGHGTSLLPDTCPNAGAGPSLARGDRIIVEVSTTFDPIVPLVNVPSFAIESAARRTILKDLEIK